MLPKFEVIVNVLLPVCFHIGSGMPILRIFVQYSVVLFGAITDKWVLKHVCCKNQKISDDQVKFATKQKYNQTLLLVKFSVKRMVMRTEQPTKCLYHISSYGV